MAAQTVSGWRNTYLFTGMDMAFMSCYFMGFCTLFMPFSPPVLSSLAGVVGKIFYPMPDVKGA